MRACTGASGIAHLTDRHPSVTPERLVAELVPPPTFAAVGFDTYRPDPAEPSQTEAVAACRQFCEQAVSGGQARRSCSAGARCCPGVGAVPRRRVRRRQDPPVGVDVLRAGRRRGRTRRVRHVRRADPAGRGFRLRRVHRAARRLRGGVHRRVRTRRPGQHDADLATALATGRARRVDRRDVEHAARTTGRGQVRRAGLPAGDQHARKIFTTVRIEGPDYRHRDLPPAPEPPTEDEVRPRPPGCRRDARRLRRAVRAPCDHAPVAVSGADRRRRGGVHHRGASAGRPERGAAAGVADRPAVRRGHPGGGVGEPSWTPSSARRCWRAGSARSTCAPRPACSR